MKFTIHLKLIRKVEMEQVVVQFSLIPKVVGYFEY